MRYPTGSVDSLVRALEELAPMHPVADLALQRWREATAPTGKNGRKGFKQHNYDTYRVKDDAGRDLRGPGGWSVWLCVRCKRHASQINQRMHYREPGGTEWVPGLGCRDGGPP